MIVLLTRKSKRNHFSSYFQDNIYNLKKVWQGINSIIANKKIRKLSIFNKFNDYFSTVAKNI